MTAAPRIPWTSEHRVTNLLGLQTLDAPALSLAHIVTKSSKSCVDSEPLGKPLATYPDGELPC